MEDNIETLAEQVQYIINERGDETIDTDESMVELKALIPDLTQEVSERLWRLLYDLGHYTSESKYSCERKGATENLTDIREELQAILGKYIPDLDLESW